jgi:hypothetical protein
MTHPIVPSLRAVSLACCAAALLASLAFATPSVRVSYPGGIPRIELEGSYPQSRYAVYRAVSSDGIGERITALDVLCLGSCYAQDADAQPGVTYWYRFDLTLTNGTHAAFGPYPVTISAELAPRVALRVLPNPVREAARIEMRLVFRDGAVPAHAVLLDLQGRTVRTLFHGTLPPGTTALRWDGRDESGQTLAAGAYFLRLQTSLGTKIARVIRVN